MGKVLLAIALIFGLLIAYVDSRPNWDDTALTAVALVAVSAMCGILGPSRPWLWALAVGSWIPLFGIASARNYGSLLAIPFAFAGAYSGLALRKIFRPAC